MNLHPLFPYRLYLVISEADGAGRDFLQVAEQAIAGGVDLIQLREKNCPTEAFAEKAVGLKKITDREGIPLIINDNVEVAMEIGAAGVHVGNHDMPPVAIRPSFLNKIIGYSIEYLEQLSNAQTTVADYLGVSPIFRTPTKKDTVTEWGLKGITKIRTLTSKPLVAIGRLHRGNARQVMEAGADCLAVVSAICAAPDPRQAALEIKNELIL